MITGIAFGVVALLVLMVIVILNLHSRVVTETVNHVSLSPWHVICLAIALLEFAIVGAASVSVGGPLLAIVFFMASGFSVVAFGIVINNLLGRLER